MVAAATRQMSLRYPPESMADAGRHLIRRRRSTIGNPKGFQIFSGCNKTFRYSNVFFYNHLCRISLVRNIIMVSGGKYKSIKFIEYKKK